MINCGEEFILKLRIYAKLFKIILAFLIFWCLCYCPKPAAATEDGWVLTQRSKTFGDQYLYLSANGVKCINPRQGIGWITQAPRWNITFFNDKTKLYYSLSCNNWKQKLIEHGLVPSDIVWSKVESGSIAGIKASEYKMTNSAHGGTNAGQSGTKSTHNGKWLSATYWLADQINVPASLSQLISAACGLPASDSVPLQLSYHGQNGQVETLLSTYHSERVPVPDQYFYLPTNYKLAKSEVAVLMSKENQALINELAEDFSHDNGHGALSANRLSGQLSTGNLPLNKLPDQVTLPGGKTVTKGQISKFLEKLK